MFGEKPFKPTLALGFPTGIYPVVSLQGGFIYSISPRMELSFSASVDGILSLIGGFHPDIYNNDFGHSLQAGLIYVFRLKSPKQQIPSLKSQEPRHILKSCLEFGA